jgi:hypothetical protein
MSLELIAAGEDSGDAGDDELRAVELGTQAGSALLSAGADAFLVR